jgi:copper(I)-binding protein
MTGFRLAASAATLGAIAALSLAPMMGARAFPGETAGNDGATHHLLVAEAMMPGEYTLGSLRIKAPWMRATPKGAKVAGGFLLITNTGSEPDRLMSVESDIAATVDVHQMTMSGGVMNMRPVDQPLVIAPGATLELKPGSYHVMFSGLKQGVKEGDKVKASLTFEKAGKVEIEFVAGGIAAGGPMPMHKM